MEPSTKSTTSAAEAPAVAEEERAERLRRLAERLRRPEGLDRDALEQVEALSGDKP